MKSKRQIKNPMSSWKQFHEEIRLQGWELLKRLHDFPNSILVTGCQRSGTTMLSIIITQSDGIVNYWFGPDIELDGALILCGYVEHTPKGRYCFQTTYLNENYHEYYRHKSGHRMVWVLRNPFSVIYSILNNWEKDALDRLFKGCGLPLLTASERKRYELFRSLGLNRLKQACFAYNGKLMQLFELKKNFNENNIIVVDYDDLVTKKQIVLPVLYEFLELKYYNKYASLIHNQSLKNSNLLSKRKARIIESMCTPIYNEARNQLSKNFPIKL
jgi:hypothetical protein